jgi:hypothetical protein
MRRAVSGIRIEAQQLVLAQKGPEAAARPTKRMPPPKGTSKYWVLTETEELRPGLEEAPRVAAARDRRRRPPAGQNVPLQHHKPKVKNKSDIQIQN